MGLRSATCHHRFPNELSTFMTAYLWIKVACIAALVLWEFAKGVRDGVRDGRLTSKRQ